jgi:cyclohexadienyl dehydratase
MQPALAPCLLVVALVACAGAPPRTQTQTAREGSARGGTLQSRATLPVLRVGTSDDYAPFSKAGRGFDVELTKRMARDLGYRVEWVRFDWPDLSRAVAGNAFDVAVGGITLRPDRAVVGFMTRALASGGPCVLERNASGQKPSAAGRVAVNRGGILERWARQRFAAEQLLVVDDNLSLPERLQRGEIDAIVTDSFELPHFARPEWRARCEPPHDRKVYWVAPARAAELAPRIEAWLAEHEPELPPLRDRWLGAASSWTPVQHLIDLFERRLSLMPAVAAYKRAHGLPLEDTAREAVVLQQAIDAAARDGLEPETVRALFAEQIALAKVVQQRHTDAEPVDLDSVLRPALDQLGERITHALRAAAPDVGALSLDALEPLTPWLAADERARLLAALRQVRCATAGCGAR